VFKCLYGLVPLFVFQWQWFLMNGGLGNGYQAPPPPPGSRVVESNIQREAVKII
jgi:hypothetical protein